MEEYIAILSDIHGNLFALQAVMNALKRRSIDAMIFLGDLIDYGQQSNEVISFLRDELSIPIICSIWGNHERAIMTEVFDGFSSPRGAASARHTAGILTAQSKDYIRAHCDEACKKIFSVGNKKCLAIHGSLDDPAWKGIMPDNVHGDYCDYDLVLSGHTHYSHCFMKFYNVDNAEMRNKKAVTFINPGSVGQPRNQNPNAQYALLDVKNFSVELRSVPYDVEAAMSLFHGQVDDFYGQRLKRGV